MAQFDDDEGDVMEGLMKDSAYILPNAIVTQMLDFCAVSLQHFALCIGHS